VRQHGLKQIPLDQYGFAEPERYIPQALFWDCQQPAARDGGRWTAISANYMEESANCVCSCSIRTRFSPVAAYAVQLPQIGHAASPVGHHCLRITAISRACLRGDLDQRWVFLNCMRDPEQLQPALDRMEESRKKK